MLTFEEISDLLHCDDETGLLIRKKRTSSRVQVGDIAGHKAADGYIYVSVCGMMFKAHRIVWLLMTGDWPTGQIDHIDGNRSNNRIGNLRDVDNRTNGRNRKLSHANTSGTTGVNWHSRSSRWRAQINDSKKKHLGYFENKEDAIAARRAAEIELGYHPNHGKRNK